MFCMGFAFDYPDDWNISQPYRDARCPMWMYLARPSGENASALNGDDFLALSGRALFPPSPERSCVVFARRTPLVTCSAGDYLRWPTVTKRPPSCPSLRIQPSCASQPSSNQLSAANAKR